MKSPGVETAGGKKEQLMDISEMVAGNSTIEGIGCRNHITNEGGKIINHSTPEDCGRTKRRETRFRTNGIVVLADHGKPVVTNICDIAPGGVSFLHPGELGEKQYFMLDILIFDSLTNFEYSISQLKGQVTSTRLVEEPKGRARVWRYGVKFLELDSMKKDQLRTLFTMT